MLLGSIGGRIRAGNPAGQTRAVAPVAPIFAVRTMNELRQRSFWEFAIFGWVFGLIGAVALTLAAAGVFSVLAYSVSQRAREIGVRPALGASPAHIRGLVMRQGLILAGTGVALGLAAATGLTSQATALLYNVSSTDPLSYVLVAVFLLGIAAVASWVPARRAMRVDLRAD